MAPTMSTLQAPPLTEHEVRARLSLWREHLLEHKAGNSNCTLTLGEVRRELDRLLDDLHWLLKGISQ
jgi:hypothetical protein